MPGNADLVPEVCRAHHDENCTVCDETNDDLWVHPRDLEENIGAGENPPPSSKAHQNPEPTQQITVTYQLVGGHPCCCGNPEHDRPDQWKCMVAFSAITATPHTQAPSTPSKGSTTDAR